MATAKMSIRLGLLLEWLHLPDGTELLEVSVDTMRSEVGLLVWHPDIPDLKPTWGVPLASPVFHQDEHGKVTLERWGVE